MVHGIITRTVRVDRSLTFQQALDATNRRQCVDHNVVNAMPKGTGDEVELHFIKFGHNLTSAPLEQEVDKLGFRLADPYSLIAFNAEDQAFADEHPNATQWKDADGNFCCATFRRWFDERCVDLCCRGLEWDGRCWIACIPK